MKRPLYLISILLTAALSSCMECSEVEKTTLFLFVDITDELNFKEFRKNYESDYKLIAPLFEVEKCHAGKFRMYRINDVSQYKYSEAEYDPIPPDYTDIQIKTKLGQPFKFNRQVDEIYNEILTEQFDLDNTVLYEPLCKALNELASDETSGKKMVILYSDMLEHSDYMSFYSPKYDTKPQYETDKVLTELETKCQCTLPNLSNIEIHVVNHRSTKTDNNMRRADLFWREVFKNAKVFHLKSNLDL